MLSKPAARAVSKAQRARSASCRRSRNASSPGSSDCTPIDSRFTPAARYAASRSGRTDSGFASSVISAPSSSA